MERNSSTLEIVVLGTQTAEQSSNGQQHDREISGDYSAFAGWRCNLTGLSQSHNLYFVAYKSEIHVFSPTFSSQKLSSSPDLILQSQPSGPDLSGYIDAQNPHNINSLLVQLLGNEEVVAAVRDDGDVDAFLVRHVIQAIERRTSGQTSLSRYAEEIRPIFQRNVGKSAWGLAIHSHARTIAVSANTQQVTIFKLGLVEQSHGGQVDEEGDFVTLNNREMDVTYHVVNGDCNIPYIAFCNTGDDPEARWLLTTDISGCCRTLDLHTMRTVQKFRFGSTAFSFLQQFDHVHAGWTIMFLDNRAFVPQETVADALGLDAGESPPGSNNRHVWDISATAQTLSDTSPTFIKRKDRLRRHDRTLTPSNTTRPPPDSSPLLHPDDTHRESVHENDVTTASADDQVTGISTEASENEDDSDVSVYSGDMYSEDEGLLGNHRPRASLPRCDYPENLCEDLPCPILHASVRNVYLLQPSGHREEGGSACASPLVSFSHVLQQDIQADYAYINVFERFNMHAYIPAIGVVVLASQKGRAVVLSLTKLPRVECRSPQGRFSFADKKTTYAMRLGGILPLASQERQNQRPFAPLAGIASGPLQGTEHLPTEKKRWRLMMMYTDNSVLSYEIRRTWTQNPAVRLESVMI